jgi:hypothetical protein
LCNSHLVNSETIRPRSRFGWQFNGQVATTRKLVLDSSNAEVARMASGLTIALWIKFDDVTPSRFQPTVQIVHNSDDNWLQVSRRPHHHSPASTRLTSSHRSDAADQ